ncbi:MAG TPA: preprotein translocase subunit YajC [Streptosporangiaceae bacterium]|nr:preprotein translocase subunit YajC [Streptosporangiaceae bacterium]
MGINALAAAEAAAKSTGSDSSLLIIVVIFAIMLIFMFRSQSRRKRAAQDTQRQVVDGARIRTTFGVYGTVVEGDDRNVIVEVAPGTRIKMLRQAIAMVVPDDEPDGVAQTMPTYGQTEPDVTATGPDLNGDGTSGKPDDRSDLTI